jgi:hypothetical protein
MYITIDAMVLCLDQPTASMISIESQSPFEVGGIQKLFGADYVVTFGPLFLRVKKRMKP